MSKRFLVGMLVVCLGAAGLSAQEQGGADAEAAEPAAPDASGEDASGEDASGEDAGGEEDDFFSSPEVEAQPGTAEVEDPAQAVEREHVGLSGLLQAGSNLTLTRPGDDAFSSGVSGDFLLDIRLLRSFKAFLDLGLTYVTPAPEGAAALFGAGGGATLLAVKEAFVDFNFANTVYLRAGKQVLKWGTGWFWNPTDLINIERRSFTDPEALRSGVFGLRTDAVFSPAFRLYTFLDLNEAADPSEAAFAARAEALLGSAELGLSGWYKGGKLPVFGVDLSAPLFWSLNLTAEAAVSWGDNLDRFDPAVPGFVPVRDRLVPRLDVGLSRSFDLLDVEDRVNVTAEFFYNDGGYEEDLFESLDPAGLDTFMSDYYQAGFYGRYYGALAVTVSRFLANTLTLSLSGIGNFSDLSGIALAGLEYVPVNNFTLSFQLGAYLGEDRREYTVSYTAPTNDPLTGAGSERHPHRQPALRHRGGAGGL